MKTPICDFVRSYANSGTLRLHMPGHKGIGDFGEVCDITEIDGADVLYDARGIIKESEENAAALFGAARTLYSAEGSSLAIRAMLYLVRLHSDKERPRILAGRNAHKTFMTAAALFDIDIEWLYPDEETSLHSCRVTAAALEAALSSGPRPDAVYVTSPDYLGNITDIKPLAEVCRRHGVLLLVDNAHGAYLRFLPDDLHPISLGADMCCDSAHKTLPVLTAGAYLHISQSAPDTLHELAESAMSMFASTSPSYLILQSLDAANAYLSNGYRERLAEYVRDVAKLKSRLCDAGFTLCGDEPMKLTLSAKPYGYTGTELASALYERGIATEFADPDYIVMMLSVELGVDCLDKIYDALYDIQKRGAITARAPIIHRGVSVMSVRRAMLSPSVELPIGDAVGKVLASANVSCPPAIPILVSGETIDENAVSAFRYYGVDRVRVVK